MTDLTYSNPDDFGGWTRAEMRAYLVGVIDACLAAMEVIEPGDRLSNIEAIHRWYKRLDTELRERGLVE